jgi:hypothetical protein
MCAQAMQGLRHISLLVCVALTWRLAFGTGVAQGTLLGPLRLLSGRQHRVALASGITN